MARSAADAICEQVQQRKRCAVRMAVEKFGASERFAYKVLGQNRSAFRKKKPDMGLEETRLRTELRAVAGKHPAWGWRKARWHLVTQQFPRLPVFRRRARA
jgi:hypothetical protein